MGLTTLPQTPAVSAPTAAKALPPPAAAVARRTALAAVLFSGLAVADRASAKVSIPSQESTAGNRGGSSYASGAAYGMEGIKKRGLSAGERKKIMSAIQRVSGPVIPTK